MVSYSDTGQRNIFQINRSSLKDITTSFDVKTPGTVKILWVLFLIACKVGFIISQTMDLTVPGQYVIF